MKMPSDQLRQPRVDPKEPTHEDPFLAFRQGRVGATAIEYGLIAAGISVAIIAVVQGLGTNLKSTFSSVSGALN